MGLSPIADIRPTAQVKLQSAESQIEPPSALGLPGRMEEDVYQRSQETADRGMEDEDAESEDNGDLDGNRSRSEDARTARLSFFA